MNCTGSDVSEFFPLSGKDEIIIPFAVSQKMVSENCSITGESEKRKMGKVRPGISYKWI